MLQWYGQPWFLDFNVFGVNKRDLFQLQQINLSVAVWVGLLARGTQTDEVLIMWAGLLRLLGRIQEGCLKLFPRTVNAGFNRLFRNTQDLGTSFL